MICSTSTIVEEVVGLENKDLAPAKRIKLSIPSRQSTKESQRVEKITGSPNLLVLLRVCSTQHRSQYPMGCEDVQFVDGSCS